MKKGIIIVVLFLTAGCGAATVTPTAPPPTAPEEAAAVETEEVAPTEASTPADTPTTTVEAEATTEMAENEAMAETTEAIEADLDHAALLNEVLFSSDIDKAQANLARIRVSNDTRFVPALIDILRYQYSLREDLTFTLNNLTDADLSDDWGEWVEWAGKNSEIGAFSGYPAWKANLFAQIDPNFLRFVNNDMAVDPNSRVEEIVWGGVRVDGIPALDNPTMVAPEQADYLEPDERVFGVSINGDTRAYPARFLDWHEMFNDVVGGQPISLAY